MPEVVNRKACDRCHEQKLGCKRLPDGRCERCVKMKMDCKSSPSLRDAKKQQQQQQQQQPLNHDSQFRKPDQQQQEERATPDRVNFTERQASVSQHPHTQMQGQQHLNVFESLQQGAERRLPKRKRTGSDNHLVRRDATLPIVATSASTDLGTLGHLSTESQPIAALGDGVISMENIVYQALSQPSIPPGHLLPARLPSAIGDYFFLHQEFPDHWNNRQSHGEPPQLQNNYPIEHYYDNQQVLPQAAVRPSTVPDPVVSSQQLAYSSTKDQQHHYYLNTAALSSNRRTLVSQQSHVAASVPRRRRSRSRHIKFDLQINNPSEISQDSQTDFIIMDQLLEVYNRVRVLSASLERVNHGEAHNADSQENPDNFTVAELYRHTNTLVDILERLATARNGPNRGTGAQLATDPSESANRMLTLSLYVRLLKMFDNLFCLVRSHLAKADPKRDELSFPSGLLPKMNIGDAALGVHPAFHMSMTVELAIQYLNRLREARTSLGLTKSGNGNGTRSDGSSASEGLASASYTDVGEVNPSTIRSQEDALSHSLQHLMGELDDYMDAMDGIDAGAGAALAK